MPVFIIHMLPQEGNGSLGAILVDLGHVDVVNEVDQPALPPGRMDLANLLL